MNFGDAKMRGTPVRLMAMVVLTLATGPGGAQEIGQPGRGLVAAQRLCAQCHAVQKGQTRSPNGNAPRFQTIAAVPGMTAIALSAALNTSHRSMPNIMLERDEQADIIAYILSLK
jgi:mono/diheme cytochrome c family protein